MKNFNRERVPETVELGETECCALAHAFSKNPEIISQLMDLVDKKSLKLFADELVKTKSLVFVPSGEMRMVYSQIAEAELKRLTDGGNDFQCGHSVEEHQKALQSVASTFSEPIN